MTTMRRSRTGRGCRSPPCPTSSTARNRRTATRARIEAAMVELKSSATEPLAALASRRHSQSALAFPALERRLGATSVEFLTSAARTPTSATTT